MATTTDPSTETPPGDAASPPADPPPPGPLTAVHAARLATAEAAADAANAVLLRLDDHPDPADPTKTVDGELPVLQKELAAEAAALAELQGSASSLQQQLAVATTTADRHDFEQQLEANRQAQLPHEQAIATMTDELATKLAEHRRADAAIAAAAGAIAQASADRDRAAAEDHDNDELREALTASDGDVPVAVADATADPTMGLVTTARKTLSLWLGGDAMLEMAQLRYDAAVAAASDASKDVEDAVDDVNETLTSRSKIDGDVATTGTGYRRAREAARTAVDEAGKPYLAAIDVIDDLHADVDHLPFSAKVLEAIQARAQAVLATAPAGGVEGLTAIARSDEGILARFWRFVADLASDEDDDGTPGPSPATTYPGPTSPGTSYPSTPSPTTPEGGGTGRTGPPGPTPDPDPDPEGAGLAAIDAWEATVPREVWSTIVDILEALASIATVAALDGPTLATGLTDAEKAYATALQASDAVQQTQTAAELALAVARDALAIIEAGAETRVLASVRGDDEIATS